MTDPAEHDQGSNDQDADMKFEVVVLPVSDVDRSKAFYERLGWRLDADRSVSADVRLISSHRQAQHARFSSVRTSRRLLRVLCRLCC